MPIVIEEMTVQVEVNSGNGNGSAAQPQSTNTSGEAHPKAALIKACVDEVMEVIRHQNER